MRIVNDLTPPAHTNNTGNKTTPTSNLANSFASYLTAANQSSIPSSNQTPWSPSTAESAMLLEALLTMQLESDFSAQLSGSNGADGSVNSNLLNLLPSLPMQNFDPSQMSSISGLGQSLLSDPIDSIPGNPIVSTDTTQQPTNVPPDSSGMTGFSSIMPLINQLSPRYGLDPKLVAAVVQQESGFSSTATSSSGAMGLMQLMPSTAKMLGVSNAYNPVSNLEGGMQYLSGLLNRYNGDTSLALAAYNAGPEAVDTYQGIPPFTQTENYVSSILHHLSSESYT
ncbi:lytic transglycosylase domain-containing protein [Sulfoacidibacillus ferrooxidans]|nr:lytic transglycosylase domain-containing protein [Sulfoacidibacillus ferrooxidans]